MCSVYSEIPKIVASKSGTSFLYCRQIRYPNLCWTDLYLDGGSPNRKQTIAHDCTEHPVSATATNTTARLTADLLVRKAPSDGSVVQLWQQTSENNLGQQRKWNCITTIESGFTVPVAGLWHGINVEYNKNSEMSERDWPSCFMATSQLSRRSPWRFAFLQ